MALALGLILFGVSSAFADSGDAYQMENTVLDSSSQILAVISDKASNDHTGLMKSVVANEGRPDWNDCSSLEDPSCDFRSGDAFYQGSAVLQNCAVTKSEFCLSSLDLATGDGAFQPATFVRESKQKVWNPDVSLNYPGGGGVALYESPNAQSAGGYHTFAVQVTLKFSWNPGMDHFDIHEMFASVLPYRGVSDPNIRGIAGWGGNAGEVCAWSEPGFCGVAQDWAPGTQARVKFSMPGTIAGWFKGRIKAPVISIDPISAEVNQLTVAAEPVDVPQLAIAQPKSEKTDLLDSNMNLGWWGGPGFEEVGLGSGDLSVANFIERYRAQLGDSSTGSVSMWNFSTINGGGGSKCLESKNLVLGVVTTNAMGYDGSAPSFSNNALTYHVSGMHYQSDKKTLTEGTYDLVMRSAVARCLYGFSTAPISATVSVIDDNGQTKTAVTTVNEKNGWLHLAAYGFTFSNPTLNVKLSQTPASNASPKPTASPGQSSEPSAKPSPSSNNQEQPAPKKTTISCIKGKFVKKVTGVSPKCPAGYQKKG